MKKVYKHSLPLHDKNYLFMIIIAILGIVVSWPLFVKGYFSHQDDLQVMRIFEMRKCFADLQIPCRWVPDMGWGNGFPLFNYYGVSTYYLGAILSYVVGFINASKILFFIALVAGSFGIYFLIRDLWGKYAGLTSAILYMFAPYKALDIYVRGALSESVALALIPFVLYFGYRLITSTENKRSNISNFISTLFLFLITHNIMTIVFVPVVVLWMFYLLSLSKFKDLKLVLISFVLAFGLSSFFILPAFLEKDLVQTESLTRFELDFRANFISVKQLFLDRTWGYGTSIPGPEGGMNFQIGWPYWVLALASFVILFFIKTKKENKYLILATFLIFIFSIFMTHNKSSFIWERISVLQYFQFPWRFLSLSILTSSILGGFLVFTSKDKLRSYLTILIISLTIALNFSYFKPHKFYKVTDSEKLSGELWDIQRQGAILDYLPKTALEPRESAQEKPLIISGEIGNSNFENYSNRWKYEVEVLNDSVIEIPVYYFPNWEIKVNGLDYPSNHDNLLGRISFSLPKGNYVVDGHFKNTSLRNFSNILSLVSFAGLIFIWKKYKN